MSQSSHHPQIKRALHYADSTRGNKIGREQIDMIYASVVDFCQREIDSANAEMDEKGEFNRELWVKTGEKLAGVLGPTVSEKNGGVDAGYTTHLAIMEAISYASGSFALSYGAHSNLCVDNLSKNGNEEQIETLMPGLLDGTLIGALAMSEEGAGSDVMSMKLKARAEKHPETHEDGFFLGDGSGHKMWITNGETADVIIVYAVTDDSIPDEPKLTAFLVETKDLKGFSVDKHENKMGMRGSPTNVLRFDNVFIPATRVLGKVNEGEKVLKSGLTTERLVLAGGPLGLAQRAIDITKARLEERIQAKRPLIGNQGLAHQLAEMEIYLEAVRSYVYDLAIRADDPNEKLTHDRAAAALFIASDVAKDITLRCLTMCGGMGYTRELGVERCHRDAILYEIGAGARDVRLDMWAKANFPGYRAFAAKIDRFLSEEFKDNAQPAAANQNTVPISESVPERQVA